MHFAPFSPSNTNLIYNSGSQPWVPRCSWTTTPRNTGQKSCWWRLLGVLVQELLGTQGNQCSTTSELELCSSSLCTWDFHHTNPSYYQSTLEQFDFHYWGFNLLLAAHICIEKALQLYDLGAMWYAFCSWISEASSLSWKHNAYLDPDPIYSPKDCE